VTTAGDAGGATVSPLAATMPLTDLGVTTGALEAGAPHLSTPPVSPAQEPVAHAPSTSLSGEITIPVVRAAQQATTDLPAPPSAASAEEKQSSPLAAAPPTSTSPPRATTQTTERRAMRVWLVGGVLVVAVLLLCGTAAGLWFLFRMNRAPATAANVDAPVAVPTDARQQAQAKIAEAQTLLAAGDPVAATARLREAIALDASNAEAHRQLAQLLLESGARQTAIAELRAVTQLEPNDKDAWRQLAETQSAEGAYADAADSYHTLLEVSNEAATDDRLQLAYADALRLAGRTDNARALYRRLATSPLADVAHASKQRLTELTAPPADGVASAPTRPDGTTITNGAQPASPTSHPPPALPAPERQSTPAAVVANTPAEHYERGVNMWGTNRAAAVTEFRAAANAGNPDAYYYLGLSLAEGRDAHTLNRAELVAALEYFQRARQGRFGSQARRYEDQLGQEFDRRRAKQ
jgi:tetratricopeptide (TPR) repeat protein